MECNNNNNSTGLQRRNHLSVEANEDNRLNNKIVNDCNNIKFKSNDPTINNDISFGEQSNADDCTDVRIDSAGNQSSQKINIQEEKRICFVGMCVLDIIQVCETYPIEDTDKRSLAGYMQRGGNASNNCTVLRELGYNNVEFLGMMTTMPGFEFLNSDCNKRNIFIGNCGRVEQSPPFSTVILVDCADSRTIIHHNPNFPIFEYNDFRKLNNQLDAYRWFHFEGRNPEHTLRMQQDILAYNKKHRTTSDDKVKISVELEKIREENLVLALHANIIFLGKDLAKHMGWNDPKAAVCGLKAWLLAQRCYDDTFSHQIICTWGALGASCLTAENHYEFVPAERQTKIVDTLGAGDTFVAATIYALAILNLNFTAGVAFANHCAGVKLTQHGYDGLKARLGDHYTTKKL